MSAALEELKNDSFGYKKCWECGEEKIPLVWVYRGRLVHLCESCRKKGPNQIRM